MTVESVLAFGRFEAPPISKITRTWIAEIQLPRILRELKEPRLSLRMKEEALSQMFLSPDKDYRKEWENIKEEVKDQVNIHLSEVITPPRLRLVAELEELGLRVIYVDDVNDRHESCSER